MTIIHIILWVIFGLFSYIFIFIIIGELKERNRYKKSEQERKEFDLPDALRALEEIGIKEEIKHNRILSNDRFKNAKDLRNQIGLILSQIHTLEQITGIPGFEVTKDTKARIAMSFLIKSYKLETIIKYAKDMFKIFVNVSDKDQADFLISVCDTHLNYAGYSNPTDAGINKWGETLNYHHGFYPGYYGRRNSIAVMQDGKTVAIPENEMVKLYNAETGAYVRSVCDKIKGNAVKISGNGERIALKTESAINVYDVNANKEVARYNASKYLVHFAISPDGKSLIMYEPIDGLIIRNIDTGEKIQTHDVQYVEDMQSLTNDRIVVRHQTLNDQKYIIYNYRTRAIENTLVYPLPESHEFLGNSQEGNKIVICNRENIKILDASNVDDVVVNKSPKFRTVDCWDIISVVYSASTKTFVFGLEDGTIQYFRLENILNNMPIKALTS